MHSVAAKTHTKRIGQSCENCQKVGKIEPKTMQKLGSQTKEPADTDFHRFCAILGVPGGAQIAQKLKKVHAKNHAFFDMRKNAKSEPTN